MSWPRPVDRAIDGVLETGIREELVPLENKNRIRT